MSVRRAARGATVQFLTERLQGAPRRSQDYGALATWRERPGSDMVVLAREAAMMAAPAAREAAATAPVARSAGEPRP